MVAGTFSYHPFLVECHDTETYRSRSPDLKISAEFILNVIEALPDQREALEASLAGSELEAISSLQWVREQKLLNLIKDFGEKAGPNGLMKIGKCLPEILGFPAQVADFEEAFTILDSLFRQYYRGCPIENYRLLRVARHAMLVNCFHAYPCEIDMGILSDITGRLQDCNPRIEHRSACRKNGSRFCSIMITCSSAFFV